MTQLFYDSFLNGKKKKSDSKYKVQMLLNKHFLLLHRQIFRYRALENWSVFMKSQGHHVLRSRRSYLPLDRCRIDWQMVGRMHNIQLITDWTCWNSSNCRSTLREEQSVRWVTDETMKKDKRNQFKFCCMLLVDCVAVRMRLCCIYWQILTTW